MCVYTNVILHYEAEGTVYKATYLGIQNYLGLKNGAMSVLIDRLISPVLKELKIIDIPYSGKFSEGKIFGNLPFINISEINFRKPSDISNIRTKNIRKYIFGNHWFFRNFRKFLLPKISRYTV